VNVHDFADRALGEFAKAIPYGVYDVGNDEGWVFVGVPSVLGIGFGGALGSTWPVRKVGQFEREDGRCLARERAPWWGGTASRLYAA
jgi:hypothetical protein